MRNIKRKMSSVPHEMKSCGFDANNNCINNNNTKRDESAMNNSNDDDDDLINVAASPTLYPALKSRRRLVDYESAPHFIRHNVFIRSGFRVEHGLMCCVKSIFELHNETGNIWSHLVGFLGFVILAVACASTVKMFHEATNFIVWGTFFTSCLACMGFSAAYHTFSCHSEHVNRFAMLLDYFGIAFLIVGSFYPPVYFVFSCEPAARATYLAVITTFGLAGMVGPCFPFFHEAWFTPWRNLLFVSLAVSGVVPLVHAHVIVPTSDPEYVFMFGLIYVMYICYGIGLFFFLTQIPERWHPGKFDYVLHSHQIWHIFVLLGALVHFYNCVRMHTVWEERGGMIVPCS